MFVRRGTAVLLCRRCYLRLRPAVCCCAFRQTAVTCRMSQHNRKAYMFVHSLALSLVTAAHLYWLPPHNFTGYHRTPLLVTTVHLYWLPPLIYSGYHHFLLWLPKFTFSGYHRSHLLVTAAHLYWLPPHTFTGYHRTPSLVTAAHLPSSMSHLL